MKDFMVGKTYITERHVAISVHDMNGIEIDEVIDYPKGEVFEVLEIVENDGEEEFVIEFWLDTDQKINGEKVTYNFGKEELSSFLNESEDGV